MKAIRVLIVMFALISYMIAFSIVMELTDGAWRVLAAFAFPIGTCILSITGVLFIRKEKI